MLGNACVTILTVALGAFAPVATVLHHADQPSATQERLDALEWRPAVDQAVRDEMARQELVGVAIGVIRDGRVVYTAGYGMADREAEVPVTDETLFRWASISKPVTAVAAMQLVEAGKLDPSADIRDYVPEFPDKGTVITTEQLLAHLGGIVHYSNGPVIRTERE